MMAAKMVFKNLVYFLSLPYQAIANPDMQHQALLSTAYFPPVQYFCKLMQYKAIVVEQYENYSKQSYRNRCNILAANGVLPLSITIQRGNSKILSKDICIDYTEDWQKQHLRSIISAYKSSPFFEYYFDDFLFVFESKERFLMDLNNKILNVCCESLEICPSISYSESYISEAMKFDFRFGIHPKSSRQITDSEFLAKPYTQVFSDRFEFISNLSILDILFNLGPESADYIRSCIVS